MKDSEKGHEANAATISAKEFNKMKERVVFLEKIGKTHKYDSSDDETAAAVDTRSERDKMISTNKMKRFYSEEVFKERLLHYITLHYTMFGTRLRVSTSCGGTLLSRFPPAI